VLGGRKVDSMDANNVLYLSFLSPTGFGKTTAVKLLARHFHVRNIKLAQPLYEMQDMIYNRLKKTIVGQDGELLQFLGNKIQRDYPEFLAKEFWNNLQKTLLDNPEFILNDDCRPHNYPFLKKFGFIFIKIDSFLRLREDKMPIDPTHSIEYK